MNLTQTKQRRLKTYASHQGEFVVEYHGKDIKAFLHADPMSDEEDHTDEDGKRCIKRLRPQWRSMDVSRIIDT